MRGHTISEIRAEALKRRGLGFPVDAIFIDHIQFMKPAKDYRGDKRREIVEITNGLMLLSKELDVPVIAVSHLSRPDRARRNDAPMVSDLKESSSIEQDSDTVTLIWRPEQHKIDGNKNKTQLIVDKNRDGPTFKTDLVAQFQYSRFEEDSVQDSDGE
jgi:replicative DNA helicase